jgi:hypothetical protein
MLINLDIPWNPAVLEQRIARIYRLGQKRNVSIINMVSAGTIEHKMLGVLSFKKGLAEGILDQGDNTVFLEDSKFKVLMNTVESLVDQVPVLETISQNPFEQDEKQPTEDIEPEEIIKQTEETNYTQGTPTFEGDDDIKQTDKEIIEPAGPLPETGSPAELVNMGMTFFGRLSETLSNPEATRKLISTIVQKDETDGRTYLKIPVENQKIVENAFALFAGLLQGLKK